MTILSPRTSWGYDILCESEANEVFNCEVTLETGRVWGSEYFGYSFGYQLLVKDLILVKCLF